MANPTRTFAARPDRERRPGRGWPLVSWAVVIWRNADDIVQSLQPADSSCALPAQRQAVYLAGMIGTFVRWFFPGPGDRANIHSRATLLLGSIGMVFNLVIPGAVGGDLIKAAYLVRMRIRKTQAIASMVIDRILGLLALFILAAVAGGFAWRLAQGDVRRLIVAAWLAVIVGVLMLKAIFALGASADLSLRSEARSHAGWSVIVAELREMSTTYRGRLDVVLGLPCSRSGFTTALNVLAFYLVGLDALPRHGDHVCPALPGWSPS